ncbi:MAG: hypothetical protein ACK4QP_05290 [Pseudorhizobium sp.]
MEMMKTITAHSRLDDDSSTVDLKGTAHAGGRPQTKQPAAAEAFPSEPTHVHALSMTYLHGHRIVACCPDHRITRAYDILRNHIAHSSKRAGSLMIAVTAPASRCGTSVTAINLAFSFARSTAGCVLLVDGNGKDPAATSLLGLAPLSILPRDGHLGGHVRLDAQGVGLDLLRPARSQQRKDQPHQLARDLEQVRQVLQPAITIVDLPPMLGFDEAPPIVAAADVVVLVVAPRQSTRAEVAVCQTYFQPHQTVQVVLNKAQRHGL